MRCHHLSLLFVLFAAPLNNLIKPLALSWDDIRVKHTWNAVPPSWETLGHPPAGTTIDLHVALKPHHENALTDALYEVSDPRSPKYGSHLSKEQVSQLVSPHPDALELINSWLQQHGVPSSSISTTHGGSWLTLSGVPVSKANELLGASYQVYRLTGTNDTTILRTIGYGLPVVLHTHIQTVVPTTYFGPTSTLWQLPRRRSSEDTADLTSRELVTLLSSRNEVTPSDLRALYRTVTYVPTAMDRNLLGIAGYNNDYPRPADLTAFMTECRTDAVDATFTVVKINDGGYDPNHPTTEASLNIQYAQAIAYPTPHIFYSTGGVGSFKRKSGKPAPGDPWLEWLNYMLSQPKVPQTISTSYGVPEKLIPREYATTLCNMIAQLGVLGVSVIFSTGDHGVGEGDCIVNDPDGSERVQFITSFPASCPWVTSVGGTRGHDPEVAASISGGGFSDHFPRPDYQHEAVPAFLQNLGKKYDGSYNPTGRGVPDVAAQALDFLIFRDNEDFLVDGTSGAAPTVAGIVSLLNDYLLSQDKPPLGFLNPRLYGTGIGGLNDITSGSNPGCGTDGFSAIVGWDPVTGLGTPDFLDLQDILDLPATFTTSFTSARATSNSATHSLTAYTSPTPLPSVVQLEPLTTF